MPGEAAGEIFNIEYLTAANLSTMTNIKVLSNFYLQK